MVKAWAAACNGQYGVNSRQSWSRKEFELEALEHRSTNAARRTEIQWLLA